MILLVVAAVTVALFWLGSREKPQYSKTYLRTRSDGVFKTEYAPGFDEYITHVKHEVAARFTVGPFSPTDDQYAELYHPEVEQNWRRDLSGNPLHNWGRDGCNLVVGTTIFLSVAGSVVAILTHPSGLLSAFSDQNITEKLVGCAFAVAVYVYVHRSRTSTSQTQGYLDGYSDCCIGPERSLRVIVPPSPRT